MQQMQENFEINKQRKGSCSTIQSPIYHLEQLQQKQLEDSFKHKKVKKNPKLRKTTSLDSTSKTIKRQMSLKDKIKENQTKILYFVQAISAKYKLHLDTELICIKIATSFKFDGHETLCKQVAAIICYFVQKMFESYKISFNQVLQETGYQLTPETYRDTQAVILQGLNFQIPSIDPQLQPNEIKNQINLIYAEHHLNTL